MTITTGTETDFTTQANASSPQTQSVVVAAGVEMLVCIISSFDTSASDGVVSGVTFNGSEAFTEGFTVYQTTADFHLSVWYLLGPTETTADVSVAFGGTITDFMASTLQVQGTVGTFAIDSTATHVQGNGKPTITWNTVATNTILFAAAGDDQPVGSRVTLDAGPTSMYIEDVGTDTVMAAFRIVSASGSQTIAWSDSDNDEDWAVQAIAFYEINAPTEYTQSEAGALTFIGAEVKKTLKQENGALTFAGGHITKAFKNLSGALTFTGAVAKLTKIREAGAITFAGAHVGVRRFFNAIAGALTFAGARTAKTLKSIAGAITFAGALATSFISGGTLFFNAIAGAMTFSGGLTRKTLKALFGALTFDGGLSHKTQKSFSGALTFVGGLSRKTFKSLAGAITFAGALATSFTAGGGTLFINAIAGALTFSGGLTHKTIKSLSGVMTFAGGLVKKTLKKLAGAISFIGALVQGHITSGARTTVIFELGARAVAFVLNRDTAFTLDSRSIAYSLPIRSVEFTLPVREISFTLPKLEGN